jgi:hypothetical protein
MTTYLTDSHSSREAAVAERGARRGGSGSRDGLLEEGQNDGPDMVRNNVYHCGSDRIRRSAPFSIVASSIVRLHTGPTPHERSFFQCSN